MHFGFNDFRFRVAIRLVLMTLVLFLTVYLFTRPNMLFAGALALVVLSVQLGELFHFSTQTNRKLTRFLESVRYSDFISGFASDNKLGKSFRDLNTAFNEVLEAFRKARSEKEEHWQYLNSVVQQVRTGILSFDQEGHVQLINANARRFMGVHNIKNIAELESINPKLLLALRETVPGKGTLHKETDFLLTIQATELRMRGSSVKLITLQNIQSELQQQELQAWQNLTRVLRHEIMNSITPISSLTSTLREVLDHDLVRKEGIYQLHEEAADDLREGLTTIEGRSKGLIKFIDAYREYTSLPQPRMKTVRVCELIEKVAQLMGTDVKTQHIEFTHCCDSEFMTIQADEEMIEQVLINLVRNAVESMAEMEHGKIEINGVYAEGTMIIEVRDNGPGIIPEALDKIFVPFFTTKKTGSGIGLSLSRQIMQMHRGSLSVQSIPYQSTVFTMKF